MAASQLSGAGHQTRKASFAAPSQISLLFVDVWAIGIHEFALTGVGTCSAIPRFVATGIAGRWRRQ
jgi:hypothetical protein